MGDMRIYVSEAAFQEAVREAAALPITPRDLFAAAALTGLLTDNSGYLPDGTIKMSAPFSTASLAIQADHAFALADAMMAERAKVKP